MKNSYCTPKTLVIAGLLSGIGMLAHAGDTTPSGQPFEGIVIEDVVTLEKLPSDVQTGSIKIDDANEQQMVALSKLTATQAIQLARTAVPGRVVEVQLDDENGYLIWEVTELDDQGKELQLKLDAGNGRLLAAETRGDDEADQEKHSKWKFWEDNDKDEKSGDRD